MPNFVTWLQMLLTLICFMAYLRGIMAIQLNPLTVKLLMPSVRRLKTSHTILPYINKVKCTLILAVKAHIIHPQWLHEDKKTVMLLRFNFRITFSFFYIKQQPSWWDVVIMYLWSVSCLDLASSSQPYVRVHWYTVFNKNWAPSHQAALL